jgi:ATP-binding cassette subfamily B protein
MRARKGYTDLVLFKRLMGEARPYWPHIGVIFVISLISTPLTLLTPLPLKIAVDSVLGSHPVPGFLDAVLPAGATRSDTALLAATAGMFVTVALLTQLQDLATVLLKTYTGERLVWRFRGKLFQHIQRLSLAYHDRIGTADSTYRIQYDAMSLQYIAVESVISLITAVSTLAGMLYVTYRIDPQLALVTLVVSPPIVFVAKVFRPRMRSQSRQVKRLESSALSVVQEVLTGLRVVKAFGQEDREQERFLDRSGEGMRARIRLALVEGGYALLIGATIGAGGAAVLFVGVRHVQQGALTLGDLLLVMGYLAQLYAPLKTMARKAGSLQNYLASAERTFGILDQAPEVPERAEARPLGRASGAVELCGVWFAYEGADRPALTDVSLAVDPGQRVGIAGATGAGKSTLMSLLTRFYDPTFGRILLDGVDLRDYKLADLRNQFGIVLQEPVLFSTSIAENIAYARPGASEAEIEAAAKSANAHDFIARMPEGYATQVGERGMRLSGGERQRISLARAFLKDAPILILDEPTSSVDVKTEAVIMEAMERLMSGRTSFMIAHRLGTLDVCERRLEIERGRISEVPPAGVPVGEVKPRGSAIARPPALNGARRGRTGGGLEGHPAVRAWNRLRPGREPRAVTVLRSPTPRRTSAAYRLEGCGSDGAAVVAKLCRRSGAEIESRVYRDILPKLPVPALRYHGMLDESGEWCWMFLEDAEGRRYSPLMDEHRRVAARWLANLHRSAPEIPEASRLPDRGPGYYLAHLRDAREALLQHLCDRAPGGDELEVISRLASQLDGVEAHWSDVTAFCDTLPRTLVHGDFVRKNVRIRAGEDGIDLVAFDWEHAGWGVPAPDLAHLPPLERASAGRFRESGQFYGLCADPCLATYRSALEDGSARPTREAVERMAVVGSLFRYLAGVHWLGLALSPRWTPLVQLRMYTRWLEDALQVAGWNGRSRGSR